MSILDGPPKIANKWISKDNALYCLPVLNGSFGIVMEIYKVHLVINLKS